MFASQRIERNALDVQIAIASRDMRMAWHGGNVHLVDSVGFASGEPAAGAGAGAALEGAVLGGVLEGVLEGVREPGTSRSGRVARFAAAGSVGK